MTCVIGNGVVVDPEALFGEIDELAAHGHRRRRPPAHQRPGAPDPAVPPRARPAARGAARRAEDRHDVARHRAGLRGQDRPPRHPRRATWPTRRRSSDEVRENVHARNRLVGDAAHGLAHGRATSCVALRRADAAVGRRRLAVPRRRRMRRGPLDPVRGRAGHAARHRPRHLSRSSPRRTRPSAASAPASAWRRARSTACSAWPRPTRRASAKGRCRPSCAAQMGDRLRESGQEYGATTGRPRRCGWYDAVAVRYAVRINGLDALALTKLDVLDGLDDDRRSARPTGCGGRDARRVPGRSSASSAVRAGLRDAARLAPPTRGRPDVRRAARRGRGPTSRASRRSAALPVGDRVDRIGSATTPSCGRTPSRPAGSAGARPQTAFRLRRTPRAASAWRIEELEAGAVAGRRRPSAAARKLAHAITAAARARTPAASANVTCTRWFGRSTVGRDDLRAEDRQIDERRRRCRRPRPRGPPASGSAAARRVPVGVELGAASGAGAADGGRPERPRRDGPRVLAVVRHDPDLDATRATGRP